METNDEPSESGGVIPVKQGIPADTLRIGVCMVVDNVSDVADADTIQNVSSQFVANSGSDPVNVLYFIVLNSDIGLDEASHQEIAKVSLRFSCLCCRMSLSLFVPSLSLMFCRNVN
jgi:hypothetical protein